MAPPLKPRGDMPYDDFNRNPGRGSDHCFSCDHPMGFHSASQTDMKVTCHLDGCNCSVGYDEAMDRAAEIRGDLEQLKYRAREKMERLKREADERVKQMPRYVHPGNLPNRDTRFEALQQELAETRRRYDALVEQAARREALAIRPIVVTTDRTSGFGSRPELPPPGGIWIENEDVYIAQQEANAESEEPKRTKVTRPEPPARRVVKLPTKRGK